ncbi:MAG: MFS transporter [Firmicutes bacterium]|nr:MFS transporter [Bacillota bacterium]
MDKRRTLLILGLAGFVVMADNWVVSPILPTIAQNIGVSIPDAALIISAYMIPFALFQLLFGFLADRYGKFRVINLAMVFFTLASALCATAAGLTDLVIYRALTGIFAASVMPVSLALIGDLFPLQQRQAAIGTFLGISFLGQGLSMAIGGSIAYFVSWRGVFATYAVFASAATILLFILGKHIPATANPQAKFWEVYRNILKNNSSLRIYILVLFEGVFLTGSFSFLGAFIKAQFDFNNFLIGLIMTAFGVMAIIGGRISGKMAGRWGRKITIVIGLAAAALANLIFVGFDHSLVLVVVGVGLLGLGLMTAHSTFLTIATEFAAQSRGVAMSLVAFSIMIGGGIGTYIGGRIVIVSSITVMYEVYALGLVLLIVAVLLNKKY